MATRLDGPDTQTGGRVMHILPQEERKSRQRRVQRRVRQSAVWSGPRASAFLTTLGETRGGA